MTGLVAGAGVAVQYVGLAQAGVASGLWPVAAGRAAALVALLPLAARTGHRPRLPPCLLLGSAATGAGATLGLALYLLAAPEQLLAVAVVLASLHPAVPVLLGPLLLQERLTPLRTAVSSAPPSPRHCSRSADRLAAGPSTDVKFGF
ncbi:hypothetical protein [Streptomyces sp. CB03238]|uniref:hypothetical protein n=1 Tax=Streptomyces sp. CB03238 TaxID=1907777 RepID=UPI001F4DA95F|nr:hypothetical protein [Streptomyces sp. CB03238]